MIDKIPHMTMDRFVDADSMKPLPLPALLQTELFQLFQAAHTPREVRYGVVGEAQNLEPCKVANVLCGGGGDVQGSMHELVDSADHVCTKCSWAVEILPLSFCKSQSAIFH